jgi:aspartyl-tRNA(Asn)/glutamyl-tRNA(Gln) amidotransferase subunit A
MKGVKIGLPRNFFAGLDEDVKTAILAAAKKYESAGAVIIEEFEMPLTEYIIPAYCIIASAESSSNFAKYDGLKYGYRSPNVKTLSDVYRLSRTEGFGFDVKKSIMLGSLMLSSKCYDAYYRKALQARSLIRDAYNKLFEQFDFILSPVVSSAVYTPDEKIDDPMTAYTKDIYTASVNLAGLPAAAVPCGLGKQGTPIGFQLIGNAFSEKKLIDAVRVYQERLS